jgi:hypothetical protein
VKEGAGSQRFCPLHTRRDVAAGDPVLLWEPQSELIEEVTGHPLFDVRERQFIQDGVEHVIRRFHGLAQS